MAALGTGDAAAPWRGRSVSLHRQAEEWGRVAQQLSPVGSPDDRGASTTITGSEFTKRLLAPPLPPPNPNPSPSLPPPSGELSLKGMGRAGEGTTTPLRPAADGRVPEPSAPWDPQHPSCAVVPSATPPSPRGLPPSDSDVGLAYMHVEGALHDRKFVEFQTLTAAQRRNYRLYHARWWRTVVVAFSVAHVCLALIERPAAIEGHTDSAERAAFVVEWLCLLVYAGDLYLSYHLTPTRSPASKAPWLRQVTQRQWPLCRLVISALLLLDVLLVLLLDANLRRFRFSRGLRPFMLVFRLRNVRKVFAACVLSLRRSLMVFYIISFGIVIYGFLGFFLMNDVVRGPDAVMDTLGGAVYNNLLLQTTIGVVTTFANHYFIVSRWTALYFVSFTFLVNVLLAKLFIAVGYASYRTHLRGKLVRKVASRKLSLNAAFDLLARGGEVGFDTWLRLCTRKRSLAKQVRVRDVILSGGPPSCGVCRPGRELRVTVRVCNRRGSTK